MTKDTRPASFEVVSRPGGGARGGRFEKTCPFSRKGAPQPDYKDIRLLQRYLSDQGKIIPSRVSSVSPRKQRELAQAIKRARYLALLSYTGR